MVSIPVHGLENLVTAVLVSAGATRDNAVAVTASLVEADVCGHPSHGVMKLPSYVRDIRSGRLAPAAVPIVVSESAGIAQIDGRAGFGHLAAALAVDTAAAKARENGLAAVAVSHAHHTGRLGRWAERIAAGGLIGMLTGAEGQPPYKVLPHGGRTGALATNPVTWAVPGKPGETPVLLDYATSVASIGKIQVAHARGERVPEGWIVDAAGQSTTDPAGFFDGGHILPFGGHKGFALGVIAELLAVGLSAGDRFGGAERSSCLFTLAIDPAWFRPAGGLADFVTSVTDRLRATPPADGYAEVLVPGEVEARGRAANADLVELPDRTWAALLSTAAELGVPAPVGAAGDRS